MINDEIKEILDEFMNFDFNSQWERIEINEYERNMLKDYITNLQQEKEDYKSRCEKANKTLKNWEKLELDDLLVAIRKTQKILNGRSDE